MEGDSLSCHLATWAKSRRSRPSSKVKLYVWMNSLVMYTSKYIVALLLRDNHIQFKICLNQGKDIWVLHQFQKCHVTISASLVRVIQILRLCGFPDLNYPAESVFHVYSSPTHTGTSSGDSKWISAPVDVIQGVWLWWEGSSWSPDQEFQPD